MKRYSILLVTLVLFLAGGISASASVLFYSESFTGSGSFDGTGFSNKAVTISITADTANITSTGQSPNVWLLSGPLTVAVDGLGSTLLTSTGGIVVNNGQGNVFAGELGITTDPNAPAFFGIFNPAFKNYDLSTTFGPVTDIGTFGAGGSTANGSLSLSSFGLVTFAVTAPAPEPMTLLLAGIALAAFGLGYRRKRLAQDAISADKV
jgi:hypothetical protein